MAQQPAPQPSKPLTDPDAWIASQAQGGGAPKPAAAAPAKLEDPDDWIAKQASNATTATIGAAKGAYHYMAERGASGIQSDLADTASSVWDTVKGGAKAAYGYARDFVTDPHSTLPTAGGIAGGLAVPEHPILGAATGAGVGETGAQLWDAAVHGKVTPNPGLDTGLAMAGGAIGETIPRIPNIRPLQTEGGQLVEKLYGKTALPHQMTNSSVLDFLYNIGHGITGSPRMAAQEAAQGDVEKGTIRNMAAGIHPSAGVTPDIQAQIMRDNAADVFTQAQKPVQSAYQKFLATMGGLREQVPDPITGVLKPGPSVGELHAERSSLLERGRDALNSDDPKAAYEANKAADGLLGRIKKLLGPQGSALYDRLGGMYRDVMEKYDNPLMSKIRRGVHPEQLADMILNPEQSFPKMTPLGGRVSQSIPEMMGRVKEALNPQDWTRLQALVLQRLYENSVKLTSADASVGELSAKAMKGQLSKMGDGAFQSLFGTNGQGIKDFAEAVATAGRNPGQTGRFFIDLRQAEAVRAVAATTVGSAAGLASSGDAKTRSEKGAVAGGVTYLVAPWALARLMTNPTTRTLFIRMLDSANNPSLQAQMATGLTRMLSQMGVQSGASSFKSEPTGPGIPEPPATATPQGRPTGVPSGQQRQ